MEPLNTLERPQLWNDGFGWQGSRHEAYSYCQEDCLPGVYSPFDCSVLVGVVVLWPVFAWCIRLRHRCLSNNTPTDYKAVPA
jgi:hypothetical protein